MALKWTEAELATLRERYATSAKEELYQLFPTRSWSAIRNMAQLQELAVKRHVWYADELRTLQNYHATCSSWDEICRKMNGIPDDVVYDFDNKELTYTLAMLKHQAAKMGWEGMVPRWTEAEDKYLIQYWTWHPYELEKIFLEFLDPDFEDLNPRTEHAIRSRKEVLVEKWTHWQKDYEDTDTERNRWQSLLARSRFDTKLGDTDMFPWCIILPHSPNTTLVYVDNCHSLLFNWRPEDQRNNVVQITIPCDMDYVPIHRQPHEAYKKLKEHLAILSSKLDKL